MRVDRSDPEHQHIASFDIETTHYDPDKGEIVSIGIAVHDRTTAIEEADTYLLHRSADRDEPTLVQEAYDILDDSNAEFLVTFNGRDFDFGFCDKRVVRHGIQASRPTLDTPETHLDLLHDDRKARADRQNVKWPSLEESLAAYGYETEPTVWNGSELTNTRFGEELGPEYLQALGSDPERAATLRDVIDEYLRDDIDKNLLLYYYDIGQLTAAE